MAAPGQTVGMKLRHVALSAVAISMCFSTASCAASGEAAWAVESCNALASWNSAAQPEADQERVGRVIAGLVPEGDSGPLAEAAREFADAASSGDRAAVVASAKAMTSACEAMEFEPTEG
jgi:hypothetical protein